MKLKKGGGGLHTDKTLYFDTARFICNSMWIKFCKVENVFLAFNSSSLEKLSLLLVLSR